MQRGFLKNFAGCSIEVVFRLGPDGARVEHAGFAGWIVVWEKAVGERRARW